MDYSFKKENRLRKAKEFFFFNPQIFYSPCFKFIYEKTDSVAKLGIAISKKLDKRSSYRNRVKRLIREGFRLDVKNSVQGKFVVIARPLLKKKIKQLSLSQVRHEWKNVLKKIDPEVKRVKKLA